MTGIVATFIVGLVFGWCLCIALDPRTRRLRMADEGRALLKDCLDYVDTDDRPTSIEDRVKQARMVERLSEALSVPYTPPVCRHCGCAHPLGDQNPASDPGLRT